MLYYIIFKHTEKEKMEEICLEDLQARTRNSVME